MKIDEAVFCDYKGYCVCGNDCGAGCCAADDPCEVSPPARR